MATQGIGIDKSGVSSNGVFTEHLTGDDMTKFMRSQQNQLATGGASATTQGQNTFGQGLMSLGPVLASLHKLVNGDQADVTQAIQPEANRIQDSFAAVRNMISQQPRGGGKAGVLAEAPYKEQQQIQDTATGLRANATGELGNISAKLAGMGLESESIGQKGTTEAADLNLKRRQQDIEDSKMAKALQLGQTVQSFASAANSLYGQSGGGGAFRK